MVELARLTEEKGCTMFALLGPIGIPELIIILAIIILIFGANRLPEIGRGIGKGIKNFKESTREGQNDGKA
jgi:sec-independent protein translocase protein TatA